MPLFHFWVSQSVIRVFPDWPASFNRDHTGDFSSDCPLFSPRPQINLCLDWLGFQPASSSWRACHEEQHEQLEWFWAWKTFWQEWASKESRQTMIDHRKLSRSCYSISVKRSGLSSYKNLKCSTLCFLDALPIIVLEKFETQRNIKSTECGGKTTITSKIETSLQISGK